MPCLLAASAVANAEGEAGDEAGGGGQLEGEHVYQLAPVRAEIVGRDLAIPVAVHGANEVVLDLGPLDLDVAEVAQALAAAGGGEGSCVKPGRSGGAPLPAAGQPRTCTKMKAMPTK